MKGQNGGGTEATAAAPHTYCHAQEVGVVERRVEALALEVGQRVVAAILFDDLVQCARHHPDAVVGVAMEFGIHSLGSPCVEPGVLAGRLRDWAKIGGNDIRHWENKGKLEGSAPDDIGSGGRGVIKCWGNW